MKNNGQLILSINIAALIVLLDLSAINIALPSLKTHFDLNVIQVSGILMSSMMMASGTALIMGRFTEQFSPKSILSIAFIIFGSSSLLTAFCTQFSTIIILRLIQGIAESALYVSGPAMIKKLLPAQSHQKEFGKWMMSCGIGISLGPILGGFLIHWFQWQAVFLINVPLSLFGLYFAQKLPYPKATENKDFDGRGALFSFLFLSFLILFFNLLSIKNIHPIYHLTTGLGSLLFLGLFLYQENKTKNALLDLHLYKIINFRLANIGFFLFFLVNVGSRFLRPFYFEEVRALSTQESGALMMVAPSIMLLVSAYIDKLSKFFNTKQLVITGNLLLCLSMWMFSLWDHQSDISFLIFSMIILGLAMGVYYPSTTQIGMKSIPHQSSGMGSASISISKSIGKLMGVLFFGILFQFFLNYLWEVEELETLARTHSIQYVFVLALIISLINSLLSFKIKAD